MGYIYVLKLLQECVTRWGTRYKMLQRIVEQEKAVCKVLGADLKTAYLKPRWQDMEVMESIIAALLPVSDLTDILSGEQRVTASCLIPLNTHLCKEALNDYEVATHTSYTDRTLKCDMQAKIRD